MFTTCFSKNKFYFFNLLFNRKERSLKHDSTQGVNKLKASITLEAALVLPLFMFAILSLGFVMEIVRLQIHIGCAAGQVSKEMGQYGYSYKLLTNLKNKKNLNNEEFSKIKENQKKDKIKIDKVVSILAPFYANEKILQLSDKNYLDNSIIVGGSRGINTIGSSILKDNKWIILQVNYKVALPFSLIPNTEFKISQYAKSHAWVGFCKDENNQGNNDDRIVYMTEFGSKYHLSKSCKYLDIDIKSVKIEDISKIRNKNGGKYYPCHRCMGKCENGCYYVTEYGNSYHTNNKCTAIHRNIIEKKLSEVEGIVPCCKECEAKK